MTSSHQHKSNYYADSKAPAIEKNYDKNQVSMSLT